MKLHLVDELPSEPKEGYEPILTFNDFLIHLANHHDEIKEIRVGSFLFGLACVYWLADHDRTYLGHLNFIIDLTDKHQVDVLREIILRYGRGEAPSCGNTSQQASS